MKFLEDVRSLLAAGMLAIALMCGASPDVLAQGFTLPDGTVQQGHISAVQTINKTPPVGVGCTIAANATDTSGNCTASAASGTITFATPYNSAPTCAVWDQSATSTVSMPVYTVSASVITLSTIISTHVLGWRCDAKAGG